MRVQGEGPVPCGWLFCGEGPGRQEDRLGRPFMGATGDELDRHLDGVSLPTRDQVYLTNIYRQYGGKDYEYTAADLQRDEPELLGELERVHPQIIVTLGRHAVRYFLGDVGVDSTWGIPWLLPRQDKLSFLPDDTVVFPLYHPAAGMHNPEMSPYVVAGFKALGNFADGNLEPRRLFDDPITSPIYQEIQSEAQLTEALQGEGPLSIDTEGWPGNPWSLQFCNRPGRSYLLRATRPELLRAFIEAVHRLRPRLLFHSALHDLGMGRSLGTPFEGLAYDDTMVMAYLLQLEPKGLKEGCLRHCNMRMDSYEDLVGDAGNDLARDYLTWLWDLEEADYIGRQQREFDYQVRCGRKIRVLPKLSRTPLQKAVSRVLQSKRPRGLWLDQVLDVQVSAEKRLGPLPEPTLDYVPKEKVIHYGCRDADGTLRLFGEYQQRVKAAGLEEVYALEMSTYPLIDRMQRVGIKPDLPYFALLSRALGDEIEVIRERLVQQTGLPEFNANSGAQVASLLFDTLGLEPIKMTPGGDRGSTNDKILEALEKEHPELPVIGTTRQYRETYKLKHTFVDRLPDFVHRWPHDGRIHTTFRTTSVITGRLAATDPNLLAQPEHGAFADDFKRGWVAEDGHYLCAWDESQVELRGLAHLSQDPVLLGVYRGEVRNADGSLIDLHAKLAQRIFGGPIAQYMHKCLGRLAAKAINFGIPMGMTNRGLCVELRKNGVEATEDDAQRWLDDTLGLYQGVRVYMDQRIAEARRLGYVRCLSGRLRYIGGIRSRNDRVREEAERFAFSTPIQESAQTIMKQAEATVWNEVLPYFWQRGYWVEPILQVHDCLKAECEMGIEQELNQAMQRAMTEVPRGFSVPLAVEGEYGVNLADVRAF